jgi:hypothetical protein
VSRHHVAPVVLSTGSKFVFDWRRGRAAERLATPGGIRNFRAGFSMKCQENAAKRADAGRQTNALTHQNGGSAT